MKMKVVKLDYSEYNLDQLRAFLLFLDKDKYPEREKEIIRQIELKRDGLFGETNTVKNNRGLG